MTSERGNKEDKAGCVKWHVSSERAEQLEADRYRMGQKRDKHTPEQAKLGSNEIPD